MARWSHASRSGYAGAGGPAFRVATGSALGSGPSLSTALTAWHVLAIEGWRRVEDPHPARQRRAATSITPNPERKAQVSCPHAGSHLPTLRGAITAVGARAPRSGATVSLAY